MFDEYRDKYRKKRSALERLKDEQYLRRLYRLKGASTYEIVKYLIDGSSKEDSKKDHYISMQMLKSVFPKGYDSREEYYNIISEYESRKKAYNIVNTMMFVEFHKDETYKWVIEASIDDMLEVLHRVGDLQYVVVHEDVTRNQLEIMWDRLKHEYSLLDLPKLNNDERKIFHYIEYVATYFEIVHVFK